MRIAVIGTGVSGMTVAYLLHGAHEITLFEANDYIGGHTHTVDVPAGGKTHAVDTGFIVFNERTYPNFVRLLRKLGVPWQKSNMSFSVHCERTGLEYCPSSFGRLFAQRRNLIRPGFWRMVRGGSREYAKALTAPFRGRIRLSCPVRSIRRLSDTVEVKPTGIRAERFDHVIVATHSDQAIVGRKMGIG